MKAPTAAMLGAESDIVRRFLDEDARESCVSESLYRVPKQKHLSKPSDQETNERAEERQSVIVHEVVHSTCPLFVVGPFRISRSPREGVTRGATAHQMG